jgi:hypothetical protein
MPCGAVGLSVVDQSIRQVGVGPFSANTSDYNFYLVPSTGFINQVDLNKVERNSAREGQSE